MLRLTHGHLRLDPFRVCIIVIVIVIGFWSRNPICSSSTTLLCLPPQEDIDGFLVGGASLKGPAFVTIANASKYHKV